MISVQPVVDAIEIRTGVKFYYNNNLCHVEPHVVGTIRDRVVLFGSEVSDSGRTPEWNMYDLEKIMKWKPLMTRFEIFNPQYIKDNPRFETIFAQV